jgi:vacuolar-type H+-ATPase subunit I/STV1
LNVELNSNLEETRKQLADIQTISNENEATLKQATQQMKIYKQRTDKEIEQFKEKNDALLKRVDSLNTASVQAELECTQLRYMCVDTYISHTYTYTYTYTHLSLCQYLLIRTFCLYSNVFLYSVAHACKCLHICVYV